MADKKSTARKRAKDPEAGSKQVQETADQETEEGFRGLKVDPTPNEHYTVDGVLADKPTPEIDEDQREKARKAVADLERKNA